MLTNFTSVVDPVTEYEYTPGFGSCDASVIRLVTGSETFESYYGASAIVVVTEAGLPETTPAETSTTTSTPSSSATVRSGSNREIPSETGSKISSTSETSTAPRTESELSTSTVSKTSSTSSNPVSSGPLRAGGAESDAKNLNTSNGKGLSTGAKAGIAVGVTVPVLVGLIYAVYLFSRRRGKAPVPSAVETPKYKDKWFRRLVIGKSSSLLVLFWKEQAVSPAFRPIERRLSRGSGGWT
ncbi:hypothetical protein TWF706_006669 [Orbilia oligospora]|nr:hypothetical protein TWF706_006669 [Orbilia oligospora]